MSAAKPAQLELYILKNILYYFTFFIAKHGTNADTTYTYE